MADIKRTRTRDARPRKSKEEKQQERAARRSAEERIERISADRIAALKKVLKGDVYGSINLDEKVPITVSFKSEHLSLIANRDNSILPIAVGSYIQLDTTIKDPQFMDRCVLVIGDEYAVSVKSNKVGVDFIRTEAGATSREKSEVRTGSNYKLIGKIISVLDCSSPMVVDEVRNEPPMDSAVHTQNPAELENDIPDNASAATGKSE